MLALKLLRRRAAPTEQDPALPRADAMPLEASPLQLDGVEAALLAGEPFVRTLENLRFADTDLNGHITHPVIVALFQNGRAQLLATPSGRFSAPGTRWVTRRLTIEYQGEIFWPGTAEVCTRVAGLGTSSVHIDQALLQDKTAKATARAIMVLMDTATRRSVTIPASMREALGEIAGGASS